MPRRTLSRSLAKASALIAAVVVTIRLIGPRLRVGGAELATGRGPRFSNPYPGFMKDRG